MRARNIKPALYRNEELAEAGVFARYLFIALWTIADRAGRLEDRPKRIKADVFPYDDVTAVDVSDAIDRLHALGFVNRYSADGVGVIEVINFAKHQRPHPKEKASELPAPAESEEECGTQAKPCNSTAGQDPAVERSCPAGADVLNADVSLIPDVLIPDPLNPPSDDDDDAREREKPSSLDWRSRLDSVNTGVPDEPKAYLDLLSVEPGFDAIRVRTGSNSIGHATRWLEEGVPLERVRDAACAARLQREQDGDRSPPNIGLVASILATGGAVSGARHAKATGNHTGFADRDYENDPWLARFNGAGASA